MRKRWILSEPLSVIDVFVFRQAAVRRLQEQTNQRQLGVLALRVGQALLDEFDESQTFVQLSQIITAR